MAFVLQDKIIGVPTKSVYLNPGYWLAILLFFGLPLYSLAQTKTLPFQQLLLGKGQDINMVYKVLRDRRGFMWFGTFNGLVRYDGSHFKHYPFDPETRHPMKGKRTEGLLESKSGGIWVLSGQRLLYHVPERDTFYRFDELLGAEPLGYANSKINPALLQDSSDQLWIRSERGLFGIKPSQNGPPFQLRHYQYPEKDSASQSSNRIQVLLYDHRHRLWLGTENGLHRYDPEKDQVVRLNRGCNAVITSLCETASGMICIGTRQKGLFLYDPDTDSFEQHLPQDTSHSIAGESVRQIVRDGKDNIWLLSGSKQTKMQTLQRFDPDTGRFYAYFEPFVPRGVTSGNATLLHTDHKGYLWVATGWGLQSYDPYNARFSEIRQRTPILNDWSLVSSFYLDPEEGVLWISTISKGLLKYAPTTDKFRLYPPSTLDGDIVDMNLLKPFYEDSRGFLWSRTGTGTHRFAFDPQNELQEVAFFNFNAKFFFEDRKGQLWMDAQDGLRCFDLQRNQLVPVPASFTAEGLKRFTQEDREGWLYTPLWGQGLKRYNPSTGEIMHFLHDPADSNSIGSNRNVPILLEDPAGNIWINGVNGLKKYNLQTGLFDNYLPGIETVYSTWENDSIMWVTTSGRGLYRFNINTAESKCYNTKNGFPTNRPIGIFKGSQNDLWMSSDVGVIQFIPSTGAVRLFDQSDGLPGTVFSYGSCQRTNGELFLPLWDGGFIRFHPDSLRSDSVLPKPAIVDFQLLNQTSAFQGIWAKDQLTLRHDQNSFRLSFTALHYAAPTHNQLRYRLEGLHETWVDPGNEHSANFIGLSPGKYIFHLKAANHDGLWSEAINFQLTILPPWWRSWWAYLFYILLLALAIYTLYTYALRQWKLKAQLELEQQEADRLKELDRVKTRLFTNISHEFRTPLTVIMGMADQLASFSMASTKTHWQHGLLMIKRNGQNLLRLVNQMLNLSRLEAGHLPLKLVQDDIIAFVKYVLESFYSLAETKNIQLSFHAEETTFFMDFDLEKLQDILSNLVTNALKFTPEGGEIQISAKVLEQTDPHLLQLAVSDTGSGIAADQLPLIFDRFYQGTDSATRSSGTGIGLALTKELVKLMEGTISVQSQVEQGSTFTLRLPIHRTAAMNTWASIDNPADISLTGSEDLNKPLLLIVEDNQDVVLYLRTLLSDHYHLQIAPNGKVGVETAIEYTPDLIVCDVMMPELDGLTLCKVLKTDQRTSHIPIILLTAKADVNSRIEGLESGADAYLAKPFAPQELLTRIRKLMEIRRQLWEHFSTSAWLGNPKQKYPEIEVVFLQQLQETLHLHYADDTFDIPALCKSLHMSRAQLYRKVKALTGKPVGHILRSYRLQQARRLLETTDLSISQIAVEVGFKHLGHFSRSFQQEFGKNPSEMRI